MPTLCAMSIDGYGAGPDRSLHYPLKKSGSLTHEWFYPTLVVLLEKMTSADRPRS